MHVSVLRNGWHEVKDVTVTVYILSLSSYTGSSEPPSSRLLHTEGISVGGLVAMGVVVLTGIVLAILLLIFNVIWRKNT